MGIQNEEKGEKNEYIGSMHVEKELRYLKNRYI
jgi:hypothetical protein